jgi:hypothetical protein
LFPLRCHDCDGCDAYWAWSWLEDSLADALTDPPGLWTTLELRRGLPAPDRLCRAVAAAMEAFRGRKRDGPFPQAEYLAALHQDASYPHLPLYMKGIPANDRQSCDLAHEILQASWHRSLQEDVDYLEPLRDPADALAYGLGLHKLLSSLRSGHAPVRASRRYFSARSREELKVARRP